MKTTPPAVRKDPTIPAPPHPRRRREPLPSQQPKPTEEDADAPRRVAEILASPSYRQADQDVDFLKRYDTRGPRLQLDYLKPELLLQQHRIAHTIVVFGSTRIPEPEAARRRTTARSAGGWRLPSASLQRATTMRSRGTWVGWSGEPAMRRAGPRWSS
jgi:hypothetical protein